MSLRLLPAGITYFALVFAAGFALGVVRVGWLVARIGERNAELLEMPLMLVVVFLAARWVVRRFRLPQAAGPRLGAGILALALLLACELTVVLPWPDPRRVPRLARPARRQCLRGVAAALRPDARAPAARWRKTTPGVGPPGAGSGDPGLLRTCGAALPAHGVSQLARLRFAPQGKTRSPRGTPPSAPAPELSCRDPFWRGEDDR